MNKNKDGNYETMIQSISNINTIERYLGYR